MKFEMNLKSAWQSFKRNPVQQYKKTVLSSLLIGHLACFTAQTTHAADPGKTIHSYFIASETGFDPVATSDVYSAVINNSIFETLYSYDYLARPLKLVPETAAALPEISADGLTYTIKIKPGIYFSDDPAFNGKKRELTSYDYAYSLKRLVDPALRSPNSWLIEGKFIGLDKVVEQAIKTNAFDYKAPITGIQTPDKYTLVLKMNEKDYNLPMILAHGPTAAVAHEVIDKYKNAQGIAMGHPIGTGPYVLNKWVPSSRIILKASPSYRGFIWDYKSNDFNDRKIIAEMTGKKMPQIDTVDIQIIEEAQSQWLAFKQKQLDWVNLSAGIAGNVIENGELKPEYKKLGMTLSGQPALSSSYVYWNLKDPVVGGLTADKIALRRAMAMAFSKEKYRNIVFKGIDTVLRFPIPPNVVGYDESFKSSIPYSVRAANLLLDQYNYKKGADGYRTLPNGKPLTITYSMTSSTANVATAEFWQRSLQEIGIRFKTKTMQFPDYLRAQKQCSVQMGTQGWLADYPDGDNFLQLFYGPNINSSNFNCAQIPEFDALYRKSKTLPAGAERQDLYLKMARILERYTPSISTTTPYTNTVVQPYIQGFKSHPMTSAYWIYIDTNTAKK